MAFVKFKLSAISLQSVRFPTEPTLGPSLSVRLAATPKRSNLHHFVYFSGFILDLITVQNSSYACRNQCIAYPAAVWHFFCGMISESAGERHGLRAVKA
jgi:hypothetical protein